MNFPFTCSACGQVNHFGWSQIGQKINCVGCAKSMTVPVPMETVGPAAPPPHSLTFRCPACRRKFSTKPEMAGKKVRCNGCGAGVRVPEGGEESVGQTSRSATLSDSGNGDVGVQERPVASSVPRVDVRAVAEDGAIQPNPLLDELGWIKTARRRKRPRSVLPSRAESMEQVRQKAAEDAVILTETKATKAKKRKKKKKGASYFDARETLQLVAGVGALVALLAFLAWGYPAIRFPMGGFLCVIGFIVYLLGSSSLRQLVAEEGLLKLLAYRFCPPYQWWYVMTHWEETRDFFAFFVAGAAIMTIGGAIIKTSEEGKRAEVSDRAYQKMKRGPQAEAPPAVLKHMGRDDD
jgi:ribosomal protein S27E